MYLAQKTPPPVVVEGGGVLLVVVGVALWHARTPSRIPRVHVQVARDTVSSSSGDSNHTTDAALDPRKALRTLNQKSFLEDFVNFWR